MNFVVKYNGVIIGNVKNNHYYPDATGITKVRSAMIFSFLKEEIDDIMEVNFFSRRIENCQRFGEGNDFSYSGDNYEFCFDEGCTE